jgi:hypothetical protein
MNIKDLNEEELFIFKWQYRMLGGFKQALIRAIMLADDINLSKLERGFPTEVGGFIKYSTEEGWWRKVQAKMKKED